MNKRISKTIVIMLIVTFFVQILQLSTWGAPNEHDQAANYFEDSNGHWCQKIIQDLYAHGAIKGYDVGGKHYLMPDNLITRAEFAQLLVKYLNVSAFSDISEISFSDVSDKMWYKEAIGMVSSKGFVKGYPDGTFKPQNPIKRSEITALSASFVRRNGEDIEIKENSCFPDVNKGDWFFDDVAQLKAKGIADGYPDGYFKPERTATRAEAFKLLYNLKNPQPTTPPVTEPPVSKIPQYPGNNTQVPTSTTTPTQASYQGGNNSYQPVATSTPTPIHLVDLIPVRVDAAKTAFSTDTSEITGSVTVEVYNEGPENNVNSFEVLLFEDMNNDTLYDSGDTVLGKSTINGVLNAHQAVETTINVKGNVQFRDNIIYAFVDSSNIITETNENNNIRHNRVDCQDKPPVGSFNPVLEWRWAGSAKIPDSVNVMMTPVIMDINNDKIPEVIFGSTSSTSGNLVEVGELRAIRGDTGEEVFSVTDSVYKINTASSIAAGDIDKDGQPEIVACDDSGSRLIVFENDGSFKWRSQTLDPIYWGAPSLADLDGDGNVEIIIGRQVLDNKGTVLWTGSASRAYGSAGPLSFASDIDGDKFQEVICGNTIYDYKGNIKVQNTSLPDGHNALANFDNDEQPEIVLVYGGNVWLLENDMSIKWGPFAIREGGFGGPPTVADFDSDGNVEIGVAGAASYSVFDNDGKVLWSSVTQDRSSNVSGSSVFDFDGDGSYEVVYRDELYLRIYSGKSGEILYQVPMSSATWYEYALVADVDNDSNAEIVAVANNNGGLGIQRGVYVYGDANDTWVNTRRIWNQHAYSVTNIEDTGKIPESPVLNSKLYNNFRCNQSADALACVDLSASHLNLISDGTKDVALSVRVGNCGSLQVRNGVKVSFYEEETNGSKVLLGTVITEKSIIPGEYLDVKIAVENLSEGTHTIYAVADDDGTGHGMVREIREDNNLIKKEFKVSGLVVTSPETTSDPNNTPKPLATVKEVEPLEAYNCLKNDKNIVIIDVRSSSEFSSEHISGALNIDYNSSSFISDIEKLDKSAKYLIYCKAGSRSSAAIDIMKQSGFTEIYNLVGGITSWKEKGYAVISD